MQRIADSKEMDLTQIPEDEKQLGAYSSYVYRLLNGELPVPPSMPIIKDALEHMDLKEVNEDLVEWLIKNLKNFTPTKLFNSLVGYGNYQNFKYGKVIYLFPINYIVDLLAYPTYESDCQLILKKIKTYALQHMLLDAKQTLYLLTQKFKTQDIPLQFTESLVNNSYEEIIVLSALVNEFLKSYNGYKPPFSSLFAPANEAKTEHGLINIGEMVLSRRP